MSLGCPRDLYVTDVSRRNEAHAIVQEIAAANLKVQMDFFPCQVAEGDVAMKIRHYERHLLVQHGQVCSKLGHGVTIARRKRAAGPRCGIRRGKPVRRRHAANKRAVSSSSSRTAIADAGVSCHALGPSRSSITLRMGVPWLPYRSIALATASPTSGAPGRSYGMTGTWPTFMTK